MNFSEQLYLEQLKTLKGDYKQYRSGKSYLLRALTCEIKRVERIVINK